MSNDDYRLRRFIADHGVGDDYEMIIEGMDTVLRVQTLYTVAEVQRRLNDLALDDLFLAARSNAHMISVLPLARP